MTNFILIDATDEDIESAAVDAYTHGPIWVQASNSGEALNTGAVTVSGSLDGQNWDAISALGFSWAEVNANKVKSTTPGMPFLKAELAGGATASGDFSVSVVLAK